MAQQSPDGDGRRGGGPGRLAGRNDLRLRDSPEEGDPRKEGEGAERKSKENEQQEKWGRENVGSSGESEAGRAQRAPVQGPAVGASLGVLRAEGTCRLPDKERGHERRRRCGAWVGVAGFLQKSAPRVTLESCPSAPLCQRCGEDSENEEAALRQPSQVSL